MIEVYLNNCPPAQNGRVLAWQTLQSKQRGVMKKVGQKTTEIDTS